MNILTFGRSARKREAEIAKAFHQVEVRLAEMQNRLAREEAQWSEADARLRLAQMRRYNAEKSGDRVAEQQAKAAFTRACSEESRLKRVIAATRREVGTYEVQCERLRAALNAHAESLQSNPIRTLYNLLPSIEQTERAVDDRIEDAERLGEIGRAHQQAADALHDALALDPAADTDPDEVVDDPHERMYRSFVQEQEDQRVMDSLDATSGVAPVVAADSSSSSDRARLVDPRASASSSSSSNNLYLDMH